MLVWPRRGRMWTTEVLHVSKPANFTGRMLSGLARPGPVITRPGPARCFFFQNYRARPPPGPCRAVVYLFYSQLCSISSGPRCSYQLPFLQCKIYI